MSTSLTDLLGISACTPEGLRNQTNTDRMSSEGLRGRTLKLTYAYRCRNCGKEFERIKATDGWPVTVHPCHVYANDAPQTAAHYCEDNPNLCGTGDLIRTEMDPNA